jgi:predicted RNA-binding protein with EMAP domain
MNNVLVPLLAQLKRLNAFNNPKERYDHKRIYQLIEVLSKDIANQMYRIMSDENMMFNPFTNFKVLFEKAEDIFKKFEDSMSSFVSKKSTGSSMSKVISNTALQIKATYHYNPLKGRMEQIFKIRELYFKLKSVI